MKKLQQKALSVLTDNIQIEIKSDDVVNIIKYFKKNSISLLDLYQNRKEFDNFYQSLEFLRALEEEKQILEKWIIDFTPIKDEWEKAGIEYIFHKSIGEMPYTSGNLDILVKQKDFKKAGELLKKLGYIDLRNIQEPHKEYYRKFEWNNEIVAIHLHERVCWVVPFEDNEHIWKHYIVDNENPIIHYPSNDDAVIIILAHHFLEDHTLSLFDLVVLKKCIDKGNIDWSFIIKTAENLRWDHALYTAIIIFNHFYLKVYKEQIGIPKEILKRAFKYVNKRLWIGDTLNKKILKKQIILPFKISHLWTRMHTTLRELRDPTFGSPKDRFIQVFGGLLDRFIQLKLKVASHPKMLITFSGIDGSGKSTHIKHLQFAFIKCGISSNYVWNRAGSMPLAQLSLKAYRYFKYGKTDKNEILASNNGSSTSTSYLPKNILTATMWKMISMVDILTYYFIKISIPLFCGKVVIVDRYLIDNIIDINRSINKKNTDTLLYKILRKFIPKPDIEYFIHTPPKIILTRTIDESLIELEEKNFIYNRLLKHNKNATIIDNTQPVDEVSNKIHREALKKFFDKYPDKFNGYKVVSWRYK